MSLEFRPGTEADLPAIIALLRQAFDGQAMNEDLLRWKYFSPTRSYVMLRDGLVIAHGCGWPVPRFNAVCLIDWVSAQSAPGMGIMLVRKMAQLAPVMLSIGGSEMTQQIMPKIGFVPKGELLTFARVLRPWKQFRTRPDSRGLKGLAQFARNAVWSMAPVGLARNSHPIPGVTLNRVNGQLRIVRIEMETGDLASLYAGVIEAARQDPEACELIALAHDGRTRRALLENGFQERRRRTVFVYDPAKTLSPDRYPLALDMLDDDMSFLSFPEYPYLT